MSPQDWAALLDCTKYGPRPNLTNAVRVLQCDPTLGPDIIWHDAFFDRVFVRTLEGVRQWRDDDDTRITVHLQESVGIALITESIVAKAVQFIARQRTKHVVRDWLQSLVWDGEPRIALAFEDYWGADGTAHTRAASQNFFIGLVARIMCPGCKLDTMPVFEGAEGTKKSSALQVLAHPWYSVSRERVDHKDFLQGMRGRWLIEIGEMQSFSRVEQTATRMMMSTQVDDYRPSHGRHVLSFPRQCAFAGTTNSDEWGADSWGLRRYWPVRCGEIRLDLLRAAREQLFAEAVQAHAAGTSWWEMPELTQALQAERQHYDEWSRPVLEWCLQQPTTDGVRVGDIWTTALKMDVGRLDKSSQMRIAAILRLARWERKTVRISGRLEKRWYFDTTAVTENETFS